MDINDPALQALKELDMIRICPTCQCLWIVSESDQVSWANGAATACPECGAQHQLLPPDKVRRARSST